MPFGRPRKSHLAHMLYQKERNDLMREMSISKEKAELLASRSKEWIFFLQDGVKITYFRTRHLELLPFF